MTALLEVCVDSVAAAVDAVVRGARRLEYCADLDQDGLTPDASELRQVVADVPVPVFAMIRPRPGNFVMTPTEVEQMLGQIEVVRGAGAAGVVLGVLTEDGCIDVQTLGRLVRAAQPLPVTFHRAFDGIADPLTALETLIELGVCRLLTSADGATAWEGRELLAQLVVRAGERMILLPGGGVRQDHVHELIAYVGAKEVHSSKVLSIDPLP